MLKLREETLSFVESAPLTIKESGLVRETPARVFAAFADQSTWTKWFPLMRRCDWVTPGEKGLGATREVFLIGLGTFREKFIAWEEERRFAFTITESSSPFANAVCEDFRFQPADGGKYTHIDWTLAADPKLFGKVTRPVVEFTMRRVFRKSGVLLERHLRDS